MSVTKFQSRKGIAMKTLLASFGALALLQTASATEYTVSYGEDFSRDLEEDYGEREGDVLSEDVIDDLVSAFDRAGVAPAKVEITILNAKPNRPTREQASDNPGLDQFRSISLGGMSLSGTAYGADGAVIATKDYKWFENHIGDVIGSSTWTDANRASRRFAKKFAKELSES